MDRIADIILSSVAASALLAGIVWIFKTWIKTRLTEDIKHENAAKLEELKSSLASASALEIEKFKAITGVEYDTLKAGMLRYSENQFAVYNELWASLCDLRNCVDALWAKATSQRLQKLAKQIHDARLKVRKGALLLEDRHYTELNELLDEFEAFRVGKKTLIELRTQSSSTIDPLDVESLVRDNGQIRDRLGLLLDSMLGCLKSQISVSNSDHVDH